MQTFLPHPSFEQSLRCLDNVRLNKQGSEARQIIKALIRVENGEEKVGWARHPATLMWTGHIEALKAYHNQAILLWIERGGKNTRPLQVVQASHKLVLPDWFGNEKFHSSHKAALLFKDLDWYSQFGWTEEPIYDYYWPSKNNGI